MRRLCVVAFVVFSILLAPAAAVGATISFSFNVPPPPYDKTSNQGWGYLVLTFDRPVEGGSFVFPPDCLDPTDGVINPDNLAMIRFGPGSYGLGETGAPSVGASAPAPYGKLTVTVEYDEADGVPELQFGEGGISYWKAKRADFTYTPQSETVTRNYDIPLTEEHLVPEPSALLLTLTGLGTAVVRLRRRARERAGLDERPST
jgi:hypothetical protein